MKYVVSKLDNRVLRAGFCDFENDGAFDPATEIVIEAAGSVDLLARPYWMDGDELSTEPPAEK